MNIIKCEKGHFYNGDKYKTCPHCEEMQQENMRNPQVAESMSNKKSQADSKQPMRGYWLDENIADTVAYKSSANTIDTVAYKPKQEMIFTAAANYPPETSMVSLLPQQSQRSQQPQQPQNSLPVGWLVAISGLEYGKQYPIFMCDNFIGSGINNSICVDRDAYVLPEHHCTLSFDFQMQKVVLNMECSIGDVFVNNAPAQENRYLNHLDRIQIGGSIYMLVELCRDGFSWWKPIWQNPEEKKTEEHAQIYDIDTVFAEEYGAAIRPDISGIRAKVNQEMMQERIPVFTEIQARETVIAGEEELEMNTDVYAGNGETTVLTYSTWRCTMCNGLNSEYVYVCKFCGNGRR